MSYNPFGYPGYSQNTPSGTSDIQGVPWVSTIEEVRSAMISYGKQMFMDRNTDRFYVKDSNGNIKAFDFKEVQIPSGAIDMNNYVTKAEFDDLRSKYEQLIQSNAATAGAQQPQPDATHACGAAVPGVAGAGPSAVHPDGCGFGND